MNHTLPRFTAAALLLTLVSGCETYKVVDETLAGYVAGEEYVPSDKIAKQLEEAQKLAEEAAKLAEEAKAEEEAAKEAAAAAKEQIAAMEMAKMQADIAAALEDLKAEKQKQDDIDALIAALDAKEEEIIAEYEAKEAEIIAKYEEEAQQPTRVNVKVYAEDDTNRNADGEATPVSVRLVALTSEHQLMGTDYFTLQDDLAGALGTTFVEELSEVSAEPGQFVSTGELEVPRTTQKIGVIASFADVDRAIWRDNIAVVDRGDEVALLVALDESTVRIIREGDTPAPVVPATFTETLPDDLIEEEVQEAEDLILPPTDNPLPELPDLFKENDLRPAAPPPADAPLMVEEEQNAEPEAVPAIVAEDAPGNEPLPTLADTFEVFETFAAPEEALESTPEPMPKPEIQPGLVHDPEPGNLVFLDGVTRMDSEAMLDPDSGMGSVNTRLLMRDPTSVQGFDIRTLSPFMPAEDFWGTNKALFLFRPFL